MKLPPKAPAFWAHDGIAAKFLGPIGRGYDAIGRLHRSLKTPVRLHLPIICVGNLTLGGGGKTPVVIALLQHLLGEGIAAHVVSRGYGGRFRGPIQVDSLSHRAGEVGDEPLLLARIAPTWVARDRIAGARAASDAGAEVVVLDDGFQNPSLVKDLSIVVVDAAYGFGNGRVFPAGPLRETVERGLARADAIALLGGDSGGAFLDSANGIPVLKADLVPAPVSPSLAGKRVLAFAGIARPQKFFATLRQVGADIVAERPFRDHHPYSDREIERLLREAHDLDAIAVTTEKDAVRVNPERRQSIRSLPVSVCWDQPAVFATLFEGLTRPTRVLAGDDPLAGSGGQGTA